VTFLFFLSITLLNLLKSKLPNLPDNPFPKLDELPENIESLVLVITPGLNLSSNLGGLAFASDFGGSLAPQLPQIGALS
jgi:hypothetical protein